MDPFKQMAEIIAGQAKKEAQSVVSGVPSELGTITASGLKLDSFKHEIPDYLVAEWTAKISLPVFFFVGTQTSPVDEQGNDLPGASTSQRTRYNLQAKEISSVKIEIKPDLQPGDRVLAIPVNGGQDAVVICKVVPNA